MKILNLYAGIGGNRKLWGDEHEITAVEYKPEIAEVYQAFFPKDTVIVADAHQYLLEHFHEYDFIWSSPPCPTHSKINVSNTLRPGKDNSRQLARGGGIVIRYPDMALYQEIILLQTYFEGKWCVENVVSYYQPLIPPLQLHSHYFWANFTISDIGKHMTRGIGSTSYQKPNVFAQRMGFDYDKLVGLDREKVLRNCVEPTTGKHILDCAVKSPSLFGESYQNQQPALFFSNTPSQNPPS